MTSQASYTITAVKDGNDLDSILMLWKKTTTNAAPAKPSGTNLNGWTEDMPEFESGAYVWTCNRVAISDPTASTPIYTYTDPVLDTHWKKLDEVYKQGTEIKNTVDNITLKYSNSNGEETSFKLTNGSIDITLLKNQVDAAATTATNFISMRSDGGIEVGNKTGDDWTGYRSQMLADSFNIVDENGSALAKYGADTIDLGLSKESSIVRFCGEEAYISYNSYYDYMSIVGKKSVGFTTDSHGTKVSFAIREHEIDIWYIGDPDDYGGMPQIGSNLLIDFEQQLIDIPEIKIRTLGGEIELRNTDIILGTFHSDYLSPSKIRGQSISGNWFNGRNSAVLATTNTPENAGYAYPFLSAKSYTGSWDVLTIGDVLYFNYVSDSNYNAGSSDTVPIEFRANGSIKNPGWLFPQKGIYLPYGVPLYVTDNDGSEHPVIMSVYAGSTDHVIFGNMQYAHLSVLIGNTTEIRANKNINIYPYYSRGYGGIVCGAQSTDRGIELKPSSNNTCSLGWSSGRWKYAFINQIYTTNSVSVDSDKRLKKDISYDLSSLDKVIDLIKPATYKLIADDEGLIRFGFIAQDAEQAFIDAGLNPDDYAFISKGETENGAMLSLGYTETNALLWHRQQQLEQRIAELEKRIA